MLALAEALFTAGETERVIAYAVPEALALAERLGDRGRVLRACRLAADCRYTQGTAGAADREYRIWAERAIQYAEPESIARSLADLALAQAQDSQGQFQQARALRLDALAVARRHVDAEALFSSAVYLLRYGAPKYWEQRVRLAEECADWPRQGAS